MKSLQTTLNKMSDVLLRLTKLMDAEQLQLCASQYNSHALQRLSEDKSSLLSTLAYLNEMRNQAEQRTGLYFPYTTQPEMARCWHFIQQHILRLRTINEHSELLLKQQIGFNQQALALLKPHVSQPFYGPDGLTQENTPTVNRSE